MIRSRHRSPDAATASHAFQGFALLTVLLIVAAIGTTSGLLLYQLGRDTLRTAQRMHQSQSFAVWQGMESWATVLLRDAHRKNPYTALGQQWARQLSPLPFAGGRLQGSLTDLQGYLNLNNLYFNPRLWSPILRPLLRSAHDQVADWLDPDTLPRENGAEDETYLLRMPAYRAANHVLILPEGLYRMEPRRGRQWLQAWKPLITTLPEPTRVNVNTAPPEVLAQLASTLSPTLWENWQRQRRQHPARNTQDFRNYLVRSGADKKTVERVFNDNIITVDSRYFLLRGTLQYGEMTTRVASLIYRNPKTHTARVVLRWLEGRP